MKTIKELKKGEFFTLKKIEYPNDMQVYIRGEYDRSSKKYSCVKYGDIMNEKFFNGDKQVFDDMEFEF